MIITLTEQDLKQIIAHLIENCVGLPRTLMERMSQDQVEMAAKMYRAAGERDMAHADELERFEQLSPEEKAAVVASIERRGKSETSGGLA